MSLISRGSAATVRDALIMGYLAEVLTVPCTLPFEAIATRLQTSKGTGAWGAISNIYNESGIKGFYKSLAAYWILNWQSAIVNTIFNQFKAWYSKLLPSYASLMPHYTYTFPDPMTFFWFHYEKELNGNQLNPKAIEGNKFSFWIPLFAICFSYASALFAAGYSISALPRPYRHLTRFCWVQFLVALGRIVTVLSKRLIYSAHLFACFYRLCIMFPVIRVKTLLQAERKKVQKESSSPCISTNGPELKSQAEKHSTPTSLSSSASTSTPLTSKPSDEEPGVSKWVYFPC